MAIDRLKAKFVLSFGPEGIDLELRPLNILIGPNGAGKSNFIDVIGLLQSTTTGLAKEIRTSGGSHEWAWKGKKRDSGQIETLIGNLRHVLGIGFSEHGITVHREVIEQSQGNDIGPVYFKRDIHRVHVTASQGEMREINDQSLIRSESILSQLKDPQQYPYLERVSNAYSGIRIYRDSVFGRNAPPRLPQMADQPNSFLEADSSNLGLVLNRMRQLAEPKRIFLEYLRQLYPGIDDYDVSIEGGTVQVFIHEAGMNSKIPATRLSDGTLRYLCLLSILCHPALPGVICIEEPELGLHPDIIPTIARLLKDASQRTQLIVTTHSDLLVDEFTEDPEAIVVCEKGEEGTTMRRLEQKELEIWLEKYSLGHLWTRGDLGGVRW